MTPHPGRGSCSNHRPPLEAEACTLALNNTGLQQSLLGSTQPVAGSIRGAKPHALSTVLARAFSKRGLPWRAGGMLGWVDTTPWYRGTLSKHAGTAVSSPFPES